jgi:hypothetical protein
MAIHGQKLEKRQALLSRVVDAGVDLFAMSASISRASSPVADNAVDLADLFCRQARRRFNRNLAGLNLPEDRLGRRVAQDLLAGRCAWLEQGIVH